MPEQPANDNRPIASASELLAGVTRVAPVSEHEKSVQAIRAEFIAVEEMIEPGLGALLESLNVPRETRKQVLAYTGDVLKAMSELERSVTGMFHQMEAQRGRDGSR